MLVTHLLHRAKSIRSEPPKEGPAPTPSVDRPGPDARPRPPSGSTAVEESRANRQRMTTGGYSPCRAHPAAFGEMMRALDAIEAKLPQRVVEPQGVLWTHFSDLVLVCLPGPAPSSTIGYPSIVLARRRVFADGAAGDHRLCQDVAPRAGGE